jgi:hypothetical protein
MRFSIYGLFTVGVVRPEGGWSKGRPIAFIEESDRSVPLFDLVIPNDLDDAGVGRFVADRFAAFARPGQRITLVDGSRCRHVRRYSGMPDRRGVAHPAFAGEQH